MTIKVSCEGPEVQSKVAKIIEAPEAQPRQRLSGELACGPWARHALKAGDRAIEFCLPDRQGRIISLSKSLQDGPVLLMVSEGGGHDILKTRLFDLAAVYPRMRAQSVTLIVLAPRWAISDMDDLPFSTLLDSHCSVATAYGLALQAQGQPRPHCEPMACGEAPADLLDSSVIPATYVISRNGEILFASIDANPTHYLQPSALLRMLEALSRR